MQYRSCPFLLRYGSAQTVSIFARIAKPICHTGNETQRQMIRRFQSCQKIRITLGSSGDYVAQQFTEQNNVCPYCNQVQVAFAANNAKIMCLKCRWSLSFHSGFHCLTWAAIDGAWLWHALDLDPFNTLSQLLNQLMLKKTIQKWRYDHK
jgi:hypothetical protein